MGRDKAFVEVDGLAMVERALDALSSAGCSPLVVVGGDEDRLRRLLAGRAEHRRADATWIADRWPGEGPLGGIATALAHTGSPTLVIATDLPALDTTTLSALLAHRDDPVDVVVAGSGRLEPLCALWLASAAPVVDELFRRGERAVHRAVARLRSCIVDVAPAALRNVNRPDDL